MRLFAPSTVPHPWAGVCGLMAAAVVWAVFLYLLIVGATWLVLRLWPAEWSFVPIVG